MAISSTQGFSILSNEPVDDRFVFNTVEDVLLTLNITKVGSLVITRRYVGLTIHITSENRNYQFQEGIEDENFVPLFDEKYFTNVNGQRLVVQGVEPKVASGKLTFDFKILDVATGAQTTKPVAIAFDDPLKVKIDDETKEVSISVDGDFSGGGSGGPTGDFLEKASVFTATPDYLLKVSSDGKVDTINQTVVHGWEVAASP